MNNNQSNWVTKQLMLKKKKERQQQKNEVKKKKGGVIHFNQSLRSKRTGCAISHLLLLVAFPFQEKRRRKQSNAIIFFL
jgi:hypothetical protein